MRLGVLKAFYMVVDRNRQYLCLSGDVATKHQDHAEFAKRMGEAQHRCSNETAFCEW